MNIKQRNTNIYRICIVQFYIYEYKTEKHKYIYRICIVQFYIYEYKTEKHKYIQNIVQFFFQQLILQVQQVVLVSRI